MKKIILCAGLLNLFLLAGCAGGQNSFGDSDISETLEAPRLQMVYMSEDEVVVAEDIQKYGFSWSENGENVIADSAYAPLDDPDLKVVDAKGGTEIYILYDGRLTECNLTVRNGNTQEEVSQAYDPENESIVLEENTSYMFSIRYGEYGEAEYAFAVR